MFTVSVDAFKLFNRKFIRGPVDERVKCLLRNTGVPKSRGATQVTNLLVTKLGSGLERSFLSLQKPF